MPGHWQQITIDNHPADLFEPAQRGAHDGALIYLHGVHLARLVENEAFTREFEQAGLPVIAPHSGPSWWTDRIWPGFDSRYSAQAFLIDQVLPWIEARWGTRPPGVALLGTSMGGQGALRTSFRHPNLFPIVAALSPAIDYHRLHGEHEYGSIAEIYADNEAARQDTATLHVHPLNWPRNIYFAVCPQDHDWHESSDRLHMKLGALGIPHVCDLETAGSGHGFGYYDQMIPEAMRFVVERLEQERRRVS